MLGFVCFDLLYIAVVITYTSQSQLLWFYISSVLDKVRTKAYSLGDAIKVRVCGCEVVRVRWCEVVRVWVRCVRGWAFAIL